MSNRKNRARTNHRRKKLGFRPKDKVKKLKVDIPPSCQEDLEAEANHRFEVSVEPKPFEATDYDAIRIENEREYGPGFVRNANMLLAERYDERTHFIYELLQNAEDALGRRRKRVGSKTVSFHLSDGEFRASHRGVPFNSKDVRGVCGVGESTKESSEIGSFGIGFKAVYAVTNQPEIHSGSEDFVIRNYFSPYSVLPIRREEDETVIILPLKDKNCHGEIYRTLCSLNSSSILFLRQIEEVTWSVDGTRSGYLRREVQEVTNHVRRVTVMRGNDGQPEMVEHWLVFSRPLEYANSTERFVEIAFMLKSEDTDRETVVMIKQSPLVVYFPTVVETYLGFLVQGPYVTTPSRDNVRSNEPGNVRCVEETSHLLVDALTWLRDRDVLDTNVLRCLPLDPRKFAEHSMFRPLFESVRLALYSCSLLPRFGGGYTSAQGAKLARSQKLRELFDDPLLGALFGQDHELAWLSADISQDRTPELRRYLMDVLQIEEVSPETVLPRLKVKFLEERTDEWVRELYTFLATLPGLRPRMVALPLIRLQSGAHVVANLDGQPNAYLPGSIGTKFPTVRWEVCNTDASKEFLQSLGLTEPHPVDDVLRNVLPKYAVTCPDVSDSQYADDIDRILHAFTTDSIEQKRRLVDKLEDTAFVIARDAKTDCVTFKQPVKVYLATERLKILFAGIEGVSIVDDQVPCLHGEAVRELLEACGAVRYLRPIPESSLSQQNRRALRESTGHPEVGYNENVEDWSLFGLETLLTSLMSFSADGRVEKSKLLWEELVQLEDRRRGVFTGEYQWTHYGSYKASMCSAFVRLLNKSDWIPLSDGNMVRPNFVCFETLGWTLNPFLLSKIQFKHPLQDQLAIAAGIEPELIDWLKRSGFTSVQQLEKYLGIIPEANRMVPASEVEQITERLGELRDGVVTDPQGDLGDTMIAGRPTWFDELEGARRDQSISDPIGTDGPSRINGERKFISYVATLANREESDPDELSSEDRMALEAAAIEAIVEREPDWKRTKAANPGFDLFKLGPDSQVVQWCEVKAMSQSLNHRPVGLSRRQFECARECGTRYWLYIVEFAGSKDVRIVRINDPVGKARTFTFDRGWLAVAVVD